MPAISPEAMAAFGAHIEEEPTTAPPSTEPKTNDTPPATVVTPPTTDASEGKGGAGTGNTAPATTKQDPVQLTPLLQEQLKRSGVELPADVKDETLVDALRSVFAPKLHPDAVRLQQALDGGMKFEDYVQNYNALEQQIALADNELVAQQLKAARRISVADSHLRRQPAFVDESVRVQEEEERRARKGGRLSVRGSEAHVSLVPHDRRAVDV